MKHKTTKISMGVTLLVCAMVSLVGVAFAIAYQGSATNQGNDADSETISVELSSYSGFLAGTYTVNTSNDGADVTLSDLKKGDVDVSSSLYTAKKFHYNAGAFALNTTAYGGSETHYSAYQIGTVDVTIRQTSGATATNVTLSISGAYEPAPNQYGFSLVYVMDDTNVVSPSDDVAVTLESGSKVVNLKAYVVYSETVPVASIGSISAFTMASPITLTFTASATDA